MELYNIFKNHPVVTTDSRDCPSGSIFFALKGASFNGNAFAAKALEQGCAYAVVDESQYVVANDNRYILVDDCLKALQQLANAHRRALGTKIIGITGTNGKTTTKELMASVLGEKYNVLYTQGNFNNDIGVPKTLLRLKPEHEIAVVEMGASHPGDIKTLVDIVEPDFALITNVGRAHLQGFGSFEGVIRTKGELYDFMRVHGGKVFIDAGNQYLTAIATGLDTIEYGIEHRDDLCVNGELVSCSPFLNFRWRHGADCWHDVSTCMIGAYNIYNMIAAACVGLYCGVSPQQIDHALASYTPSNSRSELRKTKYNTLIVDAYNANPTSMDAAIRNFKDMEVDNKMIIIGDMGELGDASAEEHSKIISLLEECDFSEVWLVGSSFANTDSQYRTFANVDEVKREIQTGCPEGKCLLIKGSNSTRLYQLPELL